MFLKQSNLLFVMARHHLAKRDLMFVSLNDVCVSSGPSTRRQVTLKILNKNRDILPVYVVNGKKSDFQQG